MRFAIRMKKDNRMHGYQSSDAAVLGPVGLSTLHRKITGIHNEIRAVDIESDWLVCPISPLPKLCGHSADTVRYHMRFADKTPKTY